jgi:hypothetical protein
LNFRRAITQRFFFAVLLLPLLICAAVEICPANDVPVTLAPKFTPGERLVYQVEMEIDTTGKTVAPITNAEGPTEAALKIGMRERLDVLSLDAQPQGDSVRFRLTWDDSRAHSISDAFDPTATDPAEPFNKLQGRSVEFTLAPNGALTDFKGLEQVLPGGMPPPESVAWIASLAAAHEFPSGGIAPGRHWHAERPIAGAPLANLFWDTQSTYDRNESCPHLAPEPQTQRDRQCAIILSRMSIERHGSAHGDDTPPDYLHNGLRTAGTWTGTGEEMGSIALDTGLLMNATETSSQNIDYTIASAGSGSSVHYTAKVQTQTGITLVEQSQIPVSGGD